jgi:hypothetical protein
MLRPSVYEATTGLWVWMPDYGEDDEEDDASSADEKDDNDDTAKDPKKEQLNDDDNNNDDTFPSDNNIKAEQGELGTDAIPTKTEEDPGGEKKDENDESTKPAASENRYEMEIGAEIRFKVKSINFTQITNTAKGLQATTTTTTKMASAAHNNNNNNANSNSGNDLRRRSSSVGLDETQAMPASMHIVASICEDGLGLTSWWGGGTAAAEEEDAAEVEEGDYDEDYEE